MPDNTTPETPASTNTNIDTGILALVLVARILGIAADPQQLAHQLGGEKMSVSELLRSVKQLELKARLVQSDWERLAKTTPPCIACFNDDSFAAIGKITPESVFIHDPVLNRPKILHSVNSEN